MTQVDQFQEAGPEWGPVVHGGARPPKQRRTGRRIVIVLLVLVLLLVIAGTGIALYASSRIDEVAVEGLQPRSGPVHVLVVGSDSREDLTPEQQAELSTGSVEGERTDTIFVMTIEGGRTALLAFPRDLYVPRCDGSSGRINAAMGLGGPGCLVETVSEFSGLPITHYLSVDFLGFRDIVDAVGGVEMCLEKPIQDDAAGIDLPAGCQTLNGTQALGFVRVRKIDNDLERIKRQQRFLSALAGEIASPSTTLNPVRLVRTSGEIGGALTSDSDLGTIDLLRLGIGMRGLASGDSVTHTVPTTPATIGGASVLEPIDSEAEALFAMFRDGSVLDSVGRTTVAPEDVDVAVLNGTGIGGLASQTADALEAKGFNVIEVGDADATERTVVLYPAGAADEAATVAAALPREAPQEESSSVNEVTVILGADVGS